MPVNPRAICVTNTK